MFRFVPLCSTQLGNFGTPWDCLAQNGTGPLGKLCAGRLGLSLAASIALMFEIVEGGHSNVAGEAARTRLRS